MRRNRARIGAVIAAIVIAASGCGKDERNTERGRGDAPVGDVDSEPKNVIQFPDRFGNVAHACDGSGHRVFVMTSTSASRTMFVVADPTCGPQS